MPLDNTAKLSDIISALQGIEGINAKADLASVVGSPATANDTMAAINAVIQEAKNDLAAKMQDGSSGAEPLQSLVDRLFVGKKWASGSKIKGSSNTITINGLSFKPTLIIVEETDSNRKFVYSANTKTPYYNDRWISQNQTIAMSSPVVVSNDGFSFSDAALNQSLVYYWIVYE
ncbi:hypothetical protein MHB65_22045 [Lysinibacillus sp. FSL K6-0075]|uniref:hypothetical protein n=1 Tax=Lysinibacillus sp. FSL K6-0075 TaxID=2921415 RepID=UPI0031592252